MPDGNRDVPLTATWWYGEDLPDFNWSVAHVLVNTTQHAETTHTHPSFVAVHLIVKLVPSTSICSYIHRRSQRHSTPHFSDPHLGHGKWQPGQSISRQSQMSMEFSKSRPASSYIWFCFLLQKTKTKQICKLAGETTTYIFKNLSVSGGILVLGL